MVLEQVDNLDNEIIELYQTDDEFIQNYHILNPTLLNCINDAIENCKKSQELYRILKDEKLVAMFGKCVFEGQENILPFFIHPKFRNQKDEIFKLVLSKFSEPLVCLSVKNKKAIKFFINNNFSMVGYVKDDGTRNCNSLVLKR